MILHGIYNNGVIDILEKDIPRIKTSVEIILKDESSLQGKDEDMINKLLSSPIEVKDFSPLTREEIYTRE